MLQATLIAASDLSPGVDRQHPTHYRSRFCTFVAMKSLYLLRHAKAENATAGWTDFDRPLSDRGRQESQAVRRFILNQDLEFDLVLSSTALRARETTEAVISAAGLHSEVRFDQRIYEASSSLLLALLSEVEDKTNALVLVGHNPGLEDLIRTLTGRAEHLSPATLAKINFEVERWSDVKENTGTLDRLVNPKQLSAG
jgi:phosphohistidine phosphatase